MSAPDKLTREQQIRVQAMAFTVDHFKEARLNGYYLTSEDLVKRAEVIEQFIAGGKK